MDNALIDDDVFDFIIRRFPIEQSDEMLRALELCHAFGLQFHDSQLIMLLMDDQNMDQMSLCDAFQQEIRNQIMQVLKEHDIQPSPDAELFHLNEIASALLLIQHLDDYTEILLAIDYNISDDEIILRTFGPFTTLDEQQLLEVFGEIQPSFIKGLSAFVQEKTAPENNATATTRDDKILKRIQAFNKFTSDHDTLGKRLITNGVAIGEPMDLYLPFIHIDSKLSIAEKALNILSVLLMARDTYQLPLIAYRKYAGQFLSSMEEVTKVDAVITHLLNDFTMMERTSNE